MLNNIFYFSLLLTFLFCLSCSDESTSPDDKETGTITDIDGNVYQTVKIGNQWWMAENLKVTHYRNGESIPIVIDASVWTNLTTGAHCYYGNLVSNVATYGRLYNWYTVHDSRNLAPAGWHVPSDSEWQTLVDYLGGSSVAGGKMKSTGTTRDGDGLWYPPNTGATNESGFSALPGGYRTGGEYEYDYNFIEVTTYFWSSTELDSSYTSAYGRHLSAGDSHVARGGYSADLGFSVRCVQD